MFLGKFWGLSAWMLELIMVLSAVLGKFSDLAVVGALLVVNAVLSFMQEHRGRWCRRNAAAAVTGQCARSARSELAGNSLPRSSSRRYRSRAARRHYPGGCETNRRSVECRPVVPHRRVAGCRQGAGRCTLVGIHCPPRRRQRRCDANWSADLLWTHHRTRAGGASETPH